MEIFREDPRWMQRCIELAEMGRYGVSPNPMVGAVLVDAHTNRSISEGFHRVFGEAHAEVFALANAPEDTDFTQTILYVSLEPCVHHGKTGPCADLVLEKNIPKVVVGCTDPNPKVAGKGIERLRAHGVEVLQSVLEDEARWLNRVFFWNQVQDIPYITLKWAESADGYMDVMRTDGMKGSQAISGYSSRFFVHDLRRKHDAICVGWNTVQNDQPKLNQRIFSAPDPKIVVLTNDRRAAQDDQWIQEKKAYIVEGYGQRGEQTLRDLRGLRDLGVQSILLEGGRNTLEYVYSLGIVSEVYKIVSPDLIGDGLTAPDMAQCSLRKRYTLDRDTIWHYTASSSQ